MSKNSVKYIVYLVRHAETWDNLKIYPENATLFERCNSNLSDDGLIQARLVGQRFENIKVDHIFTSPLIRTVQTAAEIIKRQPEGGASGVELMPKLIEIGFPEVDFAYGISDLTRMSEAEFPVEMAEGLPTHRNITYPSSKNTPAEEYARACDVAAYIENRFTNGEKIVLISHGGANNYLVPALLGVPTTEFRMSFHNTSVSRIVFYHDGMAEYPILLDYINDTSHLHQVYPAFKR